MVEKGKRFLRTPKPAAIADIVKGAWSSRQLKAIAMLANPSGKNLDDMAAEIGVHHSTITEWKKNPDFMADVHRVAAVYFLEFDLMVDRIVLREACRDSAEYPQCIAAINKARELYYKRRGLLIDRKEISGAGGGAIVIREVLPDDDGSGQGADAESGDDISRVFKR